MDSRMRRDLDNHIMGIHIRGEEEVKHSCPACGREWTAPMFFDMGGWFYHDDNQAYCPICDIEGNIIEAKEEAKG